jgi:ATP-dependent DNA helicase PIF1
MLNEMRLGKITEDTVRTFKSLARPLQFDDGIGMTELFSTRNEVENSNERRLKGLGGKSYRYEARDTGDPAFRDKLLQNMMAPKFLELREGAQVMLIKNMDETLVNGSIGIITRFSSESEFETWRHVGDLSGDEFDGDSRKRRLQAFAREVDAMGKAPSANNEFPVVEFKATDGSIRTLLCVPEEWKVELPTGEVQASRSQLPLILAWALSIHKAQGQTLERVKVDLGKVFEKGQAYVALSRATSQQGLQVLGFQKHKVMAHPRVIQFYDKLYTAEQATSKKKKQATTLTGFVYQKPAPAQTPSIQGAFAKKPRQVITIDDDEEAMAAFG